MTYNITFENEAVEDLAKLTSVDQSRIIKKIKWLGLNCNQVSHQTLSGNLSEFYKLRVGDYRIIYELDHEENLVNILRIGHRREIYKD